jgi:RNA polymerase subunit RPABC4/transcription elongation factor Spt4
VIADRAAATRWCPRCLRLTGESSHCPSCGLPQLGADAARLRVVVHRLREIDEQERALAAEAASLRAEHGRLLQALTREGAQRPPGPRREWSPELVRGVLLWLGSILVALAAVIFAVVAFIRLGDAGRAGLLAAVTVAVATGAGVARRGLPATGDALGGLALALVLVDWYALRRAGVAEGWSAPAWWALGTALDATVAALAARWLPAQRLAAAVLALASAVLVVDTVADAPWTLGVGLGLVAAASVAAGAELAGKGAWRRAAILLVVGSGLLELAAVAVIVRSPPIEDAASAAGPAAAVAAVALAPALARARLRLPAGRVAPDGLVAAAASALLASGAILLAAQWRSWALLAAVAVLGVLVVGLCRLLPGALARGTTLAAGAALVVGVAGLLGPLLRALAAPLEWATDPWTGRLTLDAATAVEQLSPAEGGLGALYPVVVMLLACGGAAGVAAARLRGARVVEPRLAGAVVSASAVGIVALLPMAAGWPLWAALMITAAGALAGGGGAAMADRAGRGQATVTLAVATAVLVILAAAWALATETGTLALAGLLVPAAAAGATVARTWWLRGGYAAVAAAALLGETAAVVLSAGGRAAQAGLTVVVVSGVVLVAGAVWRRGEVEGPVMESVGLAGLAIGILLAAREGRWLAGSLTVAVPLLLVAAVPPTRRAYAWCGAAAGVAATWAWLAVADVTLVEAYTLPAAGVALLGGAAARRGRRRRSSWLVFGPGIAVALLPSLGLTIQRGGTARPLLLTGGALLAVLAGARGRLQAPLVLGAFTLLALGVDAVLPVAAQLPRWLTIGAVGLLLLWLGATTERRLAQLRELRHRLGDLERPSTLDTPG